MKNSKFLQVSTKKVIYEAKNCFSYLPNTFKFFLLHPFWFTDKRKQD